MNDEEVKKLVDIVRRDKHSKASRLIVEALGEIGSPLAVDHLKELLSELTQSRSVAQYAGDLEYALVDALINLQGDDPKIREFLTAQYRKVRKRTSRERLQRGGMGPPGMGPPRRPAPHRRRVG